MTHPEELIKARKVKTGKMILYLLFIAFILSIPSWVQTTTLLKDFVNDGQEIANNMPEFKVENDQLMPSEDAESFIYQTNSMVFSFDPTGEITPNKIENRLPANTIGISLLEDGLYLSIPFYPIHFSYSQLNGITDKTFKEVLLSLQEMNPMILGITYIILWVSSTILALLYNFVYTVFGNLVAAITRRTLRFSETWKMVLFASTLPTIFFSLLNAFTIQPLFQLEIQVGITVYLYYLALKNLPKQGSLYS